MSGPGTATMTPTGLPIVDCVTCARRHPQTRQHCPSCGLATLFGHEACMVPAQGVLDFGEAS